MYEQAVTTCWSSGEPRLLDRCAASQEYQGCQGTAISGRPREYSVCTGTATKTNVHNTGEPKLMLGNAESGA